MNSTNREEVLKINIYKIIQTAINEFKVIFADAEKLKKSKSNSSQKCDLDDNHRRTDINDFSKRSDFENDVDESSKKLDNDDSFKRAHMNDSSKNSTYKPNATTWIYLLGVV